jgi:CRISPR-associated endonuclease/helicase Cas3
MNVGDFDEFLFSLHGVHPFPWQRRLMKVVTEEEWPRSLNLPTSAGKTAAMDVALFHLALEAEKGARRRAPVRIFFVVDRRLVVDEAYERARRISARLTAAVHEEHGILREVARRLTPLSGGNGVPLDVLRLRGGLPRERAFLRNPLQPAVIVSTVDQVGSRLLFRGYGVSEYMRPIHAALVGMDSLLILDEAHLSRPFGETLDWAVRYQGAGWTEQSVGRPLRVVEMTATPAKAGHVFSLEAEDQDHEVLGIRLNRPKPAQLITLKADGEEPDKAAMELVSTLAAEARALMAALQETIAAPVIGVIANRVATARAAFESLRDETGADAVLLTGRVRPYERDVLVEHYLPRMRAGRSEDANVSPLYVVATQTVEVGADLDFDGLATEAAALDALRQRFGRLNRLGRREQGHAVIVHVKEGQDKKSDPIYGEGLATTWKWLDKHGKKPRGLRRKIIDFGIAPMAGMLPKGEELAAMLTPTSDAPVLMPAHVDLLAQTSPPPAIEPEVALYLHGVEAQPEDVQLVWRADLPEPLNRDAGAEAIGTVTVLPPVQREAMALPVWAARAFLREAHDDQLADVEGGHAIGKLPRGPSRRFALRWRREDESEVVGPDQIRPGDTIVIPAAYGGLDTFGWHPRCRDAVTDIADEAVSEQWGVDVVRIHPGLLPEWFEGDDAPESLAVAQQALRNALSRYQEGEDLSILCDELIGVLLRLLGLKPVISKRLETLSAARRELVYPAETPQGILLRGRANAAGQFTDEDDASSLTREVLLEEHCEGVATLARSYAKGAGLPDAVANDVALAAKLHDLGKADLRFQAWMRGGDRVAARSDGRLLAKSERLAANDRLAVRLARERAGYPEGARHECYSVAMAIRNERLLAAVSDKHLVLHLIGTHHGRGRPFPPAVEDEGMRPLSFRFAGEEIKFEGAHSLERLDSGWAERYWQLISRYGYWGLAYLEALVRLADHRRSEEGH